MKIILEIPLLAPGLNGPKGLMRMHFRAYGQVKITWVQWMQVQKFRLVRNRGLYPLPQCTVHIHREFCRGGPMDLDNLYATAKVPLDAMRSAGLIPEDNPDVVTGLLVTQAKVAKVGDTRTVMTLEVPDELLPQSQKLKVHSTSLE